MVRDDSLLNENFEGYHITAEIGSNAFSPTFLGERISSHASYQRVIIKLLSSTPIHDQQRQQDILQKISILQKLQHPHILPIVAAGIHKDMPYIMTEYLPSGSLYDRLQLRPAGQPVHPEEASLMLAQVGRALHYAHQQQVIHGYLKPQNILFNIRNEALVTGFHRYSLQLSDEAEDTDIPELSLYRAPEQLTGQTSEKSDQYALGCLAYTLFTGHKPFTVPSVHTPGTYYKTRSLIAPGRLNTTLPLHIEEAILKAMSRDPDQRYDDIAAFLDAMKLPPAAGNREMRETIVTLAQIMKEKVSDQSTTPSPGAGTDEAVKKQLPTDRVGPGGPLTFSNFGSMPTDRVGPGGPLTFPDATLDKYLDENNQATLKIQQPYGVSRHSFNGVKKSFTARPRRIFALIVCLMAIIIVFVTTLINLNFPMTPQKVNMLPSIHETSTANSSSHISTSLPTSDVTVPSQKATPRSTISHASPTSVPTMVPTSAPTPAPKQIQVALGSFFNNKGIGNAPGQANFDGTGYSYPASQLPPGGQITLQGVPYQFPGNGSGINDNMVAFGQTVPLKPGSYRQALLLASSTWGPVSGTITIRYADGSISMKSLAVADWYANPGVLNMPYRYTPNGIDNHPVCIYAIPIRLDSTRLANALIFPTQFSKQYQNGLIHIFALTLLR